MTETRSSMAVATGLIVGVVLIVLSLMIFMPPFSMVMYPLVIGATEYSPVLILLDLAWCVAAGRLFRGHPVLRPTMMLFLIVTAVLAAWPLTQFVQVSAVAREQLGTESTPVGVSLWTMLRGLPVEGDVRERVVSHAAANGAPLTMRLYSLGSRAARPTVVVIYGGAWRSGDATQGQDVSRALAARGYTVAAIDYRHAPAFHYPAHLDDVRRSIAILRDSAAAWNIDVRRMAVLGRSAGGHLAELTAFAPGDVPLQAVIGIYAPYDLVEGYRDLPRPDPIDVRSVLRDFLGGTPDDQPARYREASPATHVRGGLPPTLLIFGGRDHVIKAAFNRRAASELRAARVPVVAVEIPWADHGFDLAPGGLGSQLAFSVVVDFLNRTIGSHPAETQ